MIQLTKLIVGVEASFGSQRWDEGRCSPRSSLAPNANLSHREIIKHSITVQAGGTNFLGNSIAFFDDRQHSEERLVAVVKWCNEDTRRNKAHSQVISDVVNILLGVHKLCEGYDPIVRNEVVVCGCPGLT